MRTLRSVLVVLLTFIPVAAAAQQAPPGSAATPAPPAGAAQQTPQTPKPAPAAPESTVTEYVSPLQNVADFGVRGTSLNGDSARYERYRDLGDGLFLQRARLTRERGPWLFEAAVDNAGRRNQRFSGSVGRPGLFKVWALWDQIPMVMSRTTRTLFVEDLTRSPAVLTIPDALQTQVQTSTAALPGLFAGNAQVFPTQSRRHIGQGGLDYLIRPDFTIKTSVRMTNRQGTLPYGGSFGQSSLVEIPAPIDHRLTDFDSSAEFSRTSILLRGGVTGSWFHNENTQVTFDNPFRATDLAATPSRGRSSLAPSNSFVGVNGLASIKLPARSRVTGYVSVGSLKDAGAPLMAQTINSVNLPAIAPLPRNTVDGEARTGAMNLTFLSRPNRFVEVDARYRWYDYDNRTPDFVMTQRVSYDNAPAAATFSTLGGATSPLTVETEPFGITRHSLDLNLRVQPAVGSAGIGYSRLEEERTHRFFESTRENVLRLSYDVVGTGPVSLRTKFEHGARRGEVTDESERELFNIGEQPDMRHFDIAPRDRDRLTVLGSVSPTKTMVVSGSIAAGKDDYLESAFGLRDNTHRIYGASMDLSPGEHVDLGASYSFERYVALQRSRQANPPAATATVSYETFLTLSAQPTSTVQVADASRNWASTGADRVHAILAHADITGLREKVDLHFTYDFSRARALYTYATGPDIVRTLPEDVVPPASTLPNPTQLPVMRSDLHRGTADAIVSLSRHVGIGVSYWYEQYRVSDFTLDVEANPELARGQALLLGYLYRPYTANTVWGRIIYRW